MSSHDGKEYQVSRRYLKWFEKWYLSLAIHREVNKKIMSKSVLKTLCLDLTDFIMMLTSFISPNKTSVWMVLSWASSNIMIEYCNRSGSIRHSRNNIPSVIYLITVSGLVQSSKRIVYPTCDRRKHFHVKRVEVTDIQKYQQVQRILVVLLIRYYF